MNTTYQKRLKYKKVNIEITIDKLTPYYCYLCFMSDGDPVDSINEEVKLRTNTIPMPHQLLFLSKLVASRFYNQPGTSKHFDELRGKIYLALQAGYDSFKTEKEAA